MKGLHCPCKYGARDRKNGGENTEPGFVLMKHETVSQRSRSAYWDLQYRLCSLSVNREKLSPLRILLVLLLRHLRAKTQSSGSQALCDVTMGTDTQSCSGSCSQKSRSPWGAKSQCF